MAPKHFLQRTPYEEFVNFYWSILWGLNKAMTKGVGIEAILFIALILRNKAGEIWKVYYAVVEVVMGSRRCLFLT